MCFHVFWCIGYASLDLSLLVFSLPWARLEWRVCEIVCFLFWPWAHFSDEIFVERCIYTCCQFGCCRTRLGRLCCALCLSCIQTCLSANLIKMSQVFQVRDLRRCRAILTWSVSSFGEKWTSRCEVIHWGATDPWSWFFKSSFSLKFRVNGSVSCSGALQQAGSRKSCERQCHPAVELRSITQSADTNLAPTLLID